MKLKDKRATTLTDISQLLMSDEFIHSDTPYEMWIGIDPSSSNTGISVCVHNPVTGSVFVVGCVSIKPVGKLERHKCYDLFCEMRKVLKYILEDHQTLTTLYRYSATIHVAIEIPAFIGGGKQRLNRDMVHRDSVTACRLAVSEVLPEYQDDFYIYGEKSLWEHKDKKEKPIRPIEIQGQAGAVKIPKKLKKQKVQEWVEESTTVMIPFKSHDESDAAGVVLTAINKGDR